MDQEFIQERRELSRDRMIEIENDPCVAEKYQDYFSRVASFIRLMDTLLELLEKKEYRKLSLEELQQWNQKLYQDILEKNYAKSYGNPRYAKEILGEEFGGLLCFLYSEIRSMIPLSFEGRIEEIISLQELFIEVYNLFEEGEPDGEEVRKTLYWFVSDYADVSVAHRVLEQIDPAYSMATQIIMEEDLRDPRTLYYFGEFISENELKVYQYLNSLLPEELESMARTYTEGYRMGFVRGNKDLSRKKVVNIRYRLGFEPIIKQAILQFREMGLEPAIYRAASLSINRNGLHRVGFYGGIPNKQYDYDHKEDSALYLDKALVERKLGVLRTTYENHKKQAAFYAGPACMEVFGEQLFVPENKKEAYYYSDKQKKLNVTYRNESSRIINEYIKGEERSFTIIAYPVPEIGEPFEEIFHQVVKINTLDYKLYEGIQQTLIDALDQGAAVEIHGMNGNRTDLLVALWELKDPEKETIFENCVADVNIPVGEVFTSPKLTGTNGILHVSQVYLNELLYKDLEITLKNGMVEAYSCKNFEEEEENLKYIEENLLFHHKTLPLGEFAIGTNTTAYVAAKKYGIEDKLPILIAEKQGPHFALGDTCFSWEEEVATFNPDGKEIIAKENEVSALRKEDISKAYLNCHTDITIPYDELGELSVIKADGSKIEIIREGRFVLPGTEELNKPFEEI